MAIRSYSGDHGKATPGVVSLTLSLRAVRPESKEERKRVGINSKGIICLYVTQYHVQ